MGKRDIEASGAVVLRGDPDAREVLVVHRPRYDDWSLPKGKMSTDEYLAVTAVREVREETGYRVRLRAQLSTSRYTVEGTPKLVTWWLAEVTDQEPAESDTEADEVAWWSVERAVRELTYADDVTALTEALRAPDGVPVLVVRHAKAMSRHSWQGPDADRRLTERGRRQAKALSGLFDAFGVTLLASSSSTRCMKTLEPYAKRHGLSVQGFDELSEEGAEADPAGVVHAMATLREQVESTGEPLALCGHRPVLPAMYDFIGVAPEHPLRPAETTLLLLDGGKSRQPLHIAPKL